MTEAPGIHRTDRQRKNSRSLRRPVCRLVVDLNDEAVMLDWAARQGLDRRRFAEAYRSPEVQRRVDEARTVGQRDQLTGVPSLVVDGRYLTSNTYTGSADDTLAMVDRLVQRVREERAPERR